MRNRSFRPTFDTLGLRIAPSGGLTAVMTAIPQYVQEDPSPDDQTSTGGDGGSGTIALTIDSGPDTPYPFPLGPDVPMFFPDAD